VDWNKVDPVLRAVYGLLSGELEVEPEQVCAALGRDVGDEPTSTALRELRQYDYIEGIVSGYLEPPRNMRATEKGLQQCAGWPKPGSESVFVAQFLTAIDARANDASVPAEERSRLKKLFDAAGAVGKDVLTDVAAKVLSP
jgi:hypothetical protein